MIRYIRILATFLWAGFTLWMFVYSMPISGVFSAVFLWHLQPFRPTRPRNLWLMVLVSPLVVWNVGLVEYSRQTIDLHCRVLGYAGVPKTSSCWVAPKAYQAGRDHTGGPLFSTREQLGVHAFNLILATGGLLTGLPEVAWETLYMSFAPDPFDDGAAQQPKQVRLAQCKGGGKGTQTHPDAEAKGPGGFLLDSSTIRSLVAPRVAKAARLKEGETRDFKPRRVVFKGPVTTDDNAYYGGLMRSDNFRAPITLVVPDGRLHVSATHNDSVQRFDIRWSGTISYPDSAQFSFDVPTVWSLPGISGLTGLSRPFPVVVSESIFCGMTMDGAMNPYVQHWETTALVSDERFTETGKRKSVHGWIELLLGTVM